MLEFDMNTVVGVGALALGLGGGIGLIAFTEKQGEANAGRTLDVPCVECTGRLVKDCTICEGTGARRSLPGRTPLRVLSLDISL